MKIPALYARCGRRALSAAAAWCVTVPETHPAVAKVAARARPPAFLMERIRIDEVVRKVARRRAAERV